MLPNATDVALRNQHTDANAAATPWAQVQTTPGTAGASVIASVLTVATATKAVAVSSVRSGTVATGTKTAIARTGQIAASVNAQPRMATRLAETKSAIAIVTVATSALMGSVARGMHAHAIAVGTVTKIAKGAEMVTTGATETRTARGGTSETRAGEASGHVMRKALQTGACL